MDHNEGKINTDSSQVNNKTNENEQSKSSEDIVDELIQKACLAEGSSDEEYISAEEDDDAENSFVIDSLKGSTDSIPIREIEKESLNNEEKEDKEDELKDKDEVEDKLEKRRKEEENLTDEEKVERREKAQTHKNNGNTSFRNGNFTEACGEYTNALDICPLNFHKDRAIMYANRAACKMKEDNFEEAITDSSHAIELHPQYIKAILRRAELYEKTDKLDEALKDYESVVQLDPSQHAARMSCMRLQEQIKERNEKLKAEMMGKLKDLGNLVLRPFGLNTNNFKLQQDPSTGSYSVQFQQNPTGNGS